MTEAVSNIIAFHAGALGDVVNTLPAFHVLRQSFPGARVTAVGNLFRLALLESAGVIDRAGSLDGSGFHHLFSDGDLPSSLVAFLRGFDLAVSWIREPRLIAQLERLGIRTLGLQGEFPPKGRHVSKFMTGPLFGLGIDAPPAPRLSLPEAIAEKGPRFPGILVHPGSGSAHKNWPARRFAKTAATLCKASGLEALVVEGPADAGPVEEFLRAAGEPRLRCFSGLSTIELAVLLKSSRLVLANDSGVAHLAGALGAPVAAVFGPTDPLVWGVRQESARNIYPGFRCSPCPPEKMRSCKKKDCLDRVTADMVVEAGLDLLKDRGARSEEPGNGNGDTGSARAEPSRVGDG